MATALARANAARRPPNHGEPQVCLPAPLVKSPVEFSSGVMSRDARPCPVTTSPRPSGQEKDAAVTLHDGRVQFFD
ncbi:unnamed protein product [Urochloa humidicola]